jgi:hypothetical protein
MANISTTYSGTKSLDAFGQLEFGTRIVRKHILHTKRNAILICLGEFNE